MFTFQETSQKTKPAHASPLSKKKKKKKNSFSTHTSPAQGSSTRPTDPSPYDKHIPSSHLSPQQQGPLQKETACRNLASAPRTPGRSSTLAVSSLPRQSNHPRVSPSLLRVKVRFCWVWVCGLFFWTQSGKNVSFGSDFIILREEDAGSERVTSVRGLETLSCSDPQRAGITSAMCSSSSFSRSIERLVDLLLECLLGLLSVWLAVVWCMVGLQFGLSEWNIRVSRPSQQSIQLETEFRSEDELSKLMLLVAGGAVLAWVRCGGSEYGLYIGIF